MHYRETIIFNSISTRTSKQIEVVRLVLRNIFIDYLNIIIPIWTNLFVMESKSVDKLMDNRVFRPASKTCNDEKDTKFEVRGYPNQKYPQERLKAVKMPKKGQPLEGV